MPSPEAFNWLHLTDLHHGQAGQPPLWPNARQAFFEDLRRLHQRCGPWQAVLFTGDLVYSGQRAELARMEEEVLGRLWKELAELGSGEAVLLAVPGNHDLIRPPKVTGTVRQLTRKDGFAEIEEEFWRDPDRPEEARPRAILALLCLADEPNVGEEVARRVLRTLEV